MLIIEVRICFIEFHDALRAKEYNLLENDVVMCKRPGGSGHTRHGHHSRV